MVLCFCVHCCSFRRLLGGLKLGSVSQHTGLGDLEKKGMWLLSGNCWNSLFSVLRGALLSCNSGCQVKERRLWDGVSSSPGLLNWLCYCRPVQGEGSARESGLRFIKKYRALRGDPPPWGRVFTAALSWEGDLASILLPALLPADNGPSPPSPLPPTPASSTPPLSEVIFFSAHPFGPVGSR